MLTATGNINQAYSVIGVVNVTVSRGTEKAGCFKPDVLPINAAYRDATAALVEAAAESGADGVIHIGYDYRMATRSMGCNNVQPLFEVYAWGTAIRLG